MTGSWITLAANDLTLAAGESREVRFSVTIPTDARPDQHLGGIVAEAVALKEVADVSDDAETTSFQVKVQSRNAMAVQVNLPGAVVEQIDVTGITADTQANASAPFAARYSAYPCRRSSISVACLAAGSSSTIKTTGFSFIITAFGNEICPIFRMLFYFCGFISMG
ncbi:MAG: hypothetical protein IPM39_24755 [Chloroflexi bacterium]|nr:hypothetical protein [Chloroflexota bacterium]